ncbi:AraC family transcriptional regulator [Oleomonas cavernae]|uniref:AraC family transcriptional regulator n=1 Tax=Oleomonas cavernae TaxID=2320859 RepID=A0A418WFC3_9PROT|nr:AraC family transcriptional regulator ligand-binding domain-containing protein [Oleomonas cavernae]RJF88619.1 AraC family transcriptional regulator [Oleomonas cavernae]
MTDMIGGTSLLHYASLVSSLGGDPEALIRARGVDPTSVGDPDRLMSFSTAAALVGSAAAELNCPDFGMRLAKWQGIQILGPVALLIRHSETVADAIDGVSRFLYHCAPPDIAKLKRGPQSAVFTLEVARRQLAYREQWIEKGLVIAMEAFRLMLGEAFVPLRVTMQHRRISPPGTYRKYFGRPVEFGCELNSVHLPADALCQPIRGRDPAVLALAESHLAQIGPALPLVEHVRELIHQMFKVNRANLVSIAQAMDIHPRVLQRRLAEAGSSFEGILDVARRDLARHLSATGMPVSQIAAMLGYAEQSSYTRACWRWYSESPRQLIARCRRDSSRSQVVDR